MRRSILLLLPWLAACDKPVEAPVPPRPALVVMAGAQSSPTAMGMVGEVRPRYESAQGFRIAGKVIERLVENGAVVRKGQVLARLDPADMSLAAQAAQADVRAAEADRALAAAELNRQKQLYERKFISHSALDIHEAQYQSAEARVKQARAQAVVSGNQSRYTALLADRDGVVTDIRAEPGQVVDAGMVIARIADPGQMEVVVSVPESRMDGVAIGAPVVVRLWAKREKTYQGTVREVAPAADTMTRTFLTRVAITDADDQVRWGMTAGVRFVGNQAQALLVPSTALTERDGQSTLWIVDPGSSQVQPRTVERGAFREDGVLITRGLSTGEQVVAAGVHALVPGQVVRPVENGAAR